jgi:4-hydroxybenzoate polyprenyltransferase/phosphoserine phosphatase
MPIQVSESDPRLDGARRAIRGDGDAPPLIVDVDGCLLRSDLLWEGFVRLAATRPRSVVGALASLRHGRAAVKEYVAGRVPLPLETMPLEPAVVRLMADARDQARRVILMSGAHRSQVEVLGARLGTSGAFGSDGYTNLTGRTKLELIRAKYSEFDYVGNGPADLPLWRAAHRAYAANAGLVTRWRARRARPDLVVLTAPSPRWRVWLRSLRLHQWAKNALLFLPALAAHLAWTPDLFAAAALGFLAFGFTASSIYLVNDLVDLPHDRRHPTKRLRPFANGDLSIRAGLITIALLLAAAGAVALALPRSFALVLGLYLVLTTAYTFVLKQKPFLDVIVLAVLYTTRVIAGAALVAVPLSRWFLGFSVFFFLSLALVKRVVELQGRFEVDNAQVPGRGYDPSDVPVLMAFGAAAAVASALVYCLYITGDDVLRQYEHPDRLWAGLPLLLYWLGRAWLFAGRRAMTEDPVVFALRDRVSRLALLAFLGVILAAI